MSQKEHDLITKMYSNRKENYRPIIYDLIDFEHSSFKNLLFEIILSCLSYNPIKRPSTLELLKSVSQLENLFERKSNYHHISSHVSKQNSYAESNNDYNRYRENKDTYLESIRNRTRMRRKYDSSCESNKIVITDESIDKKISITTTNNNSEKEIFTYSKEGKMNNEIIRAISSEPLKHTDSLKSQNQLDFHFSEQKAFKYIDYSDNENKKMFKTINETPSKKMMVFTKNLSTSEKQNDEFKSFNSSKRNINLRNG